MKKHDLSKALTLLAVGVFCAASLLAADIKTIAIADGGTLDFDLASSDNKYMGWDQQGTSLVAVNATVRLTSETAGAGADAVFQAGIYSPNGGNVTIDGTSLSGYSSTLVMRGVIYIPKGTLTIKGFTKVVYGSATRYGNSSITIPSLSVKDVLFQNASGETASGSIEFVNSAALNQDLATCPYTVSAGAAFWGAIPDVFHADAQTVYLADGWTIGLAADDAVSNGTMKVTGNQGVVWRHCGISYSQKRLGNWGANGGTAVIGNNIVLQDADTYFDCVSNLKVVPVTEHQLNGVVSGVGSVMLSAQSRNRINMTLAAGQTYTGRTVVRTVGSVGGNHSIAFKDPTPPTSMLVLSNMVWGAFSFRPTGYGTQPTAVTVNGLEVINCTTGVVEIAAQQTVTFGTVSGKVTFAGDATGKVIINQLKAGSQIRLTGGVKLQVNASEGDPDVILGAEDDTAAGRWSLSGPTDTAADALRFKVTEVVPGGTIAYGGKIVLEPSIMDKAALWCDASATRTLPDGTVTNTVDGVDKLKSYKTVPPKDSDIRDATGIVAYRWNDCRANQTTYCFANKRYEDSTSAWYTTIFPRLVDPTADLNDHAFVGMEGSAAHLNLYNLKTASRTATIATKLSIVVSSGGNGGGFAVLGTQDGLFARQNKAGTPIATNSTCTVYKNGTEGQANVLTLDKGWQILSMETEDAAIQGLGFESNGAVAQPTNRGYTRYAEVMLFTNALTEVERKIVEERLSAKYGISISHANTGKSCTFDLDVGNVPSATPVLTLADDLPRTPTLNLSFAAKPALGRYALLSGVTIYNPTLGTVTGYPSDLVSLVVEDGVLYADIAARGTIMIIR